MNFLFDTEFKLLYKGCACAAVRVCVRLFSEVHYGFGRKKI